MPRDRFPLTSDQLELLIAFEKCDGLTHLAEVMAKDISGVSRNLQRLAETCPVITKIDGRWQITPLGRQINSKTQLYLEELKHLCEHNFSDKFAKQGAHIFEHAALIVINAQKGLLDPLMGERCNVDAEKNIFEIMGRWRTALKPVIHVKHVSKNPQSLFFRDSKGVGFIDQLKPRKDELIIEKSKSSAFSDTNLLQTLNEMGLNTLIITGFTANECIDATARQASDLGFTTYVVGDATASFDVFGPDEKLYKADRIHKLTLANLHALFSKVIDTKFILDTLK